MKTSNYVTIIGFLIFLKLICFWCMDVSVAAMINNGIMTNGFFTASANTTYHIGLIINVIITFLLFLIIIHILVKDKKESEKNEKEK